MPKCGVCYELLIEKDMTRCYFCEYVTCDGCINIQYSIYLHSTIHYVRINKKRIEFLCSFNCILNTIKFWSMYYINSANSNNFTTNNDIQIYDKIMKCLNKQTKLLLSEYICKDNQQIVIEYIR